VIYLALPELLHVAERTLGPDNKVRDYGLLEAALARPQASAFGKDAYPNLDTKAAALMHSIARNHALVDGNKRLTLAAAIAFYGLNGRRLTLTNDEAYDLVTSIATGQFDTTDAIAAVLRDATQPRWLKPPTRPGPHLGCAYSYVECGQLGAGRVLYGHQVGDQLPDQGVRVHMLGGQVLRLAQRGHRLADLAALGMGAGHVDEHPCPALR
jgi:death on curing protein